MQVVVDETIDYLKSQACLSFPDHSLPFTLNCVASEKGLGAVLYQKQDGVNKIISCASRNLRAPEKIIYRIRFFIAFTVLELLDDL